MAGVSTGCDDCKRYHRHHPRCICQHRHLGRSSKATTHSCWGFETTPDSLGVCSLGQPPYPHQLFEVLLLRSRFRRLQPWLQGRPGTVGCSWRNEASTDDYAVFAQCLDGRGQDECFQRNNCALHFKPTFLLIHIFLICFVSVCLSTVWLSNHRQHCVLSMDISVHSPVYGEWC